MPLLGYEDWNSKGKEIDKLCLSSNLILQQNAESEPTLLHKRHNTTSRPDLTFVSADIQDRTSVRVLGDIGSDHKPTKIVIGNCEKADTKRKTFLNFRKANWNEYTTSLDHDMSLVDTNGSDLDKISDTIVSTILKSARKAIPKILALFEKYDINATWATVGLLFNETDEDYRKD